jgi:putative copper resistance protein D
MDQAGGSETFPIFQLLAITRWIQFASISVMFGAALFWSCIDSVAPPARAATARLLRIAALTAAISGVFWLAEIVANMTGSASKVLDPATLRLFFFETPFGAVAMLRLILFAAAVLIAVLPWPNRVLFSLNLLVGALLLISQAWLGHAAEGGGGLFGAVMILVYCVHVLAAAAWVGSLPPLVFALRELRGLKPAEACEGTYQTLSRYSVMALVAVGLIIISGAVNAGFRSEFTPGRLFDSEYGLVLLVKAGAVSAMLALACFNRFVVTPGLRVDSTGDAQAARLRISVSLELTLGVLVLGAAALLGITPPPG